MTATREEVEALLYREARLLDERRFEDWLELFTDDCIYWVPVLDGDPRFEPSIIYDDHGRMEERVFRLLDTPAHAQQPPSRTQHDIGNVEVLPGEDGHVEVRCNLNIHEMRPGDPSQVGLGRPRTFAGRCRYRLRREDGTLRIVEKRVALIDRDLPQYNLTFII